MPRLPLYQVRNFRFPQGNAGEEATGGRKPVPGADMQQRRRGSGGAAGH
ncbi:hypothetical protein OG894_17380 [Streptomyces sp. NBC_01724]|nr:MULTISPECIES: hypothetical protein [unclassified Streptomyces]WNO66794.1 hypothetical protein RPQ02_24770 [Streptomyces sp. AM2-3-1]WSC71332.1 hypothetical protein OG807_24285 [Streptomyces sp. NBC_01760]WTE61803.1 hypothetical protein OG784_25040 [Streptomyces sp. NBC_01617]WTI89223.1 hypothetical protein OHB17_25040 [Streptomyces sp. NBC_00724]